MVDYDGTLAPFRIERSEAVPAPRVLEVLNRLARSTHTRVAVVSGRPVEELARALPSLKVPLIGEHGWEELHPGEPLVQHPLGEKARTWLAAAAVAPALSPWQDRLETKRTSVVLHARGLSAAETSRALSAARAAWTPPADAGIDLRPISVGLELRATGHDKGTAVRALADRMPKDTLSVFVGDDDTDEDAFEAVSRCGFGVRVGDAPKESRAMARLPGIEAVGFFFEEWERLALSRPNIRPSTV